jgi:hypothetical protein
MQDPDFVANLHRLEHSKGNSAKRQSNFKDPGTQTFEGLGDIRHFTLGCNRQRREADALRPCRKFFEILASSLDP